MTGGGAALAPRDRHWRWAMGLTAAACTAALAAGGVPERIQFGALLVGVKGEVEAKLFRDRPQLRGREGLEVDPRVVHLRAHDEVSTQTPPRKQGAAPCSRAGSVGQVE